MRRGAVTLMAVSALTAACTTVPITTTATPPAVSTTTTTTTAVSDMETVLAQGGLLIGTDDGVMVAPFSETPVLLPTDAPVAWVAADGEGGFVYQLRGGVDIMRLGPSTSAPVRVWKPPEDVVTSKTVGVVDGSLYVVAAAPAQANELLRVPLHGGAATVVSEVEVPVYAMRSLSTDGDLLAWYTSGPPVENCNRSGFPRPVVAFADLSGASRDLSLVNPLDEDGPRCTPGPELTVRVGGGHLVWQEGTQLLESDLANGVTDWVNSGLGVAAFAVSSDGIIAWVRDSLVSLAWPGVGGYELSEPIEMPTAAEAARLNPQTLTLYTEPIDLAGDADLTP